MQIFRNLMVEHQAGNQITVSEEYRREGHARYYKKCKEVGITSSLCYEYTKRNDGRWISLGPEFITSDQCHGRRVPWFTRIGDHFQPLSTCPPSGCLSCADTSTDGKGQCGSTLLGAAKALKISDLRRPFDGVVPTEEVGF
jgi:hypothetical protein